MPDLRFDDRVVVVTGGGRGIGRSHALLLASRGAKVVIADHGVSLAGAGSSAQPANEVVDEIKATGGEAAACVASVAEQSSAASIVDFAIDTFGRLDAVVNNAGIHDAAPFDELSIEQFRAMLDVHYFGTLYVSRAAWPHFVRAGYGRVVNTVSEAMLGGMAEQTSYGAAKGAVLGLTRNLACEGIAHGIRVNAVAPRAFTRMSAASSDKVATQRAIPKDVMDQINAAMPPDLCAPGAAYLAHESCPLTGEILRVGLGGVARIAIVHSQGMPKTPHTIEDIADNIASIMDLSEPIVAEVAPAAT